jgi:hypothetical protein
MGIFKKPKAPPQPDLVAANAAQVAANKTAATDVMNQNSYTQQTPFASNTWTTDPTTGQRTNTTTLSPEQQALYNSNNAFAQQAVGGAQGALGSFMGRYWGDGASGGGDGGASGGGGGINVSIPGGAGGGAIPGDIQKDLDYSKLTAMPTTDPGAARQQAQDALYKMQSQYLDPQMQEAQRSMEAKLTSQGLVPGTPAYNHAAQLQSDASQKAYESARQSAIAGGGAEAERAQNMALALRNQGMTEAGNLGAFHNAAQNQGANQFLTARGQDTGLQGQLGAASINAGASMANAKMANDLGLRNEQFNELTKLGAIGQGGQMIPQFGISQGNMGQYGTGDLVGAESKQYANAAAAAAAKGQGGLAGMIPGALGLAGTYFGGPLLGMAGSALGNKLFGSNTGLAWNGANTQGGGQ